MGRRTLRCGKGMAACCRSNDDDPCRLHAGSCGSSSSRWILYYYYERVKRRCFSPVARTSACEDLNLAPCSCVGFDVLFEALLSPASCSCLLPLSSLLVPRTNYLHLLPSDPIRSYLCRRSHTKGSTPWSKKQPLTVC